MHSRRLFLTVCVLLLSIASAQAADVRLTWTASASPGVTGYRIHYGVAPGTYDTQVDVGLVLTTTLTTLVPGTPYFLAASAYSPTLTSGYSNEVAYTVPSVAVGGPVAAYGFDTGTGTVLPDTSGTGNHGTISGATWTPAGRFGQALEFDGVDDLVTIPSMPSLAFTSGLTMAAWVYPTSAQSPWRAALRKAGSFFFYVTGDSSLYPVLGGILVGGQELVLYAPTPLPLTTWTHLAATYDGVTMRLYTTGQETTSVAGTGVLVTNNNPLLVGSGATSGEFFAGRLDEVRLYARALTTADIQADMEAPVIPVVSLTAPTNLRVTPGP